MAHGLRSILAFGLPPLLVLACLPLETFADEPGTPALPAQPPKTDDVVAATYVCDSGNTVSVVYDNRNADAPVATLRYKGRTFEMYNARSASGARYATEQGLEPDRGLQWWTKGNEATMSEMLMDHTAADPRTIETCKVK